MTLTQRENFAAFPCPNTSNPSMTSLLQVTQLFVTGVPLRQTLKPQPAIDPRVRSNLPKIRHLDYVPLCSDFCAFNAGWRTGAGTQREP